MTQRSPKTKTFLSLRFPINNLNLLIIISLLVVLEICKPYLSTSNSTDLTKLSLRILSLSNIFVTYTNAVNNSMPQIDAFDALQKLVCG